MKKYFCFMGVLLFYGIFFLSANMEAATYELQSVTYNTADSKDTSQNHNKERITVKYQYVNNSGTSSTRYRQYLLQNNTTKSQAYVTQCDYSLPDSFVDVNGSITQARKFVLGLSDILCGYELSYTPQFNKKVSSYDDMNAFSGVRLCVKNNFANTPITLNGSFNVTSSIVSGTHSITGNNKTLTVLNAEQCVFDILSGANVTLQGATLKGITNANLRHPLVINRGTFTVNSSTLHGHKYTGTKDPGVTEAYGGAILNYGILNLQNGAIITNNQSPYGGGLKLGIYSKTNMYAGSKVYNNIAIHGGNVALGGTTNEKATLTMSGGEIYGGKATNWGISTAGNGLGGNLYLTQQSTLTMSGGIIYGGQAPLTNTLNNSFGADIFISNNSAINLSSNARIGYTSTTTKSNQSSGTVSIFVKDGTFSMNSPAAIYGGNCDTTVYQENTKGNSTVTINSGDLAPSAKGYALKQNGYGADNYTSKATLKVETSGGKISLEGKKALVTASVLAANASILNNGGTFSGTGQIKGNLTNEGVRANSQMNLENATVSGNVENKKNKDSINAKTTTFSGTKITNYGSVTLTNSPVSSIVQNESGGVWTATGATTKFSGAFTNNGTVSLTDSEVAIRPLNNGAFNSYNNTILKNGIDCKKSGVFALFGGTVESSAESVVSLQETSRMEMSGGKVRNDMTNGVGVRMDSTAPTTFLMNGGEINGKKYALEQKQGSAVLNSGTLVGGSYDLYKACTDTKGSLTFGYRQDTSLSVPQIKTLYLVKGATFTTTAPKFLDGKVAKEVPIIVTVEDKQKNRVVGYAKDFTYQSSSLIAKEYVKKDIEKKMLSLSGTLLGNDYLKIKAVGTTYVIGRDEFTIRFRHGLNTANGLFQIDKTMSDFVGYCDKVYTEKDLLTLGFAVSFLPKDTNGKRLVDEKGKGIAISGLFRGWSYADTTTLNKDVVRGAVKDDLKCIYSNEWNDKNEKDKYTPFGADESSEKIDINKHPQTKNGWQDGDVLTLYAFWDFPTHIEVMGEEREYYEDEYIDDKILKHNIKAIDLYDGDISNKIKIERFIYCRQTEKQSIEDVNLDKLDTKKEHIGEGRLKVSITNSQGGYQFIEIPFKILENKPPELKTPERFWLLSYIEQFSNEEIINLIKEQVDITDDIDKKEELSTRIEIEGLPKKEHGIYYLTAKVKDQYGHRFYMADGEKKQYGKGKTAESTIKAGVYDGDIVRAGIPRVRFISKDAFPDTLQERSIWRTEPYFSMLEETLNKDPNNTVDVKNVWTFTDEEKDAVKTYALGVGNPYRKLSADGFKERFSHCKKR